MNFIILNQNKKNGYLVPCRIKLKKLCNLHSDQVFQIYLLLHSTFILLRWNGLILE